MLYLLSNIMVNLVMNILYTINGTTASATDIRKSWTKIVQGVKETHKPVFVFTNNTPEAVVLSYQDFQAMQLELEMARREEYSRQMVADLLEISVLENKPIKKMQVDSDGIFHEVEGE